MMQRREVTAQEAAAGKHPSYVGEAQSQSRFLRIRIRGQKRDQHPIGGHRQQDQCDGQERNDRKQPISQRQERFFAFHRFAVSQHRYQKKTQSAAEHSGKNQRRRHGDEIRIHLDRRAKQIAYHHLIGNSQEG